MNMIEKVARAIAQADLAFKNSNAKWEQYPDKWQKFWMDQAKAAIEAMREPTEEMIKAGRGDADEEWITNGDLTETWNAMIDAALKDTSPGD